jgi:hypothetical protein
VVKKMPQLFLRRMPPPPPPPPVEVQLAERLVRVLKSQRTLGGNSYPVRQKQLVELAEPRAKPTLLRKALATELFGNQVAPILKIKSDPVIAFKEDFHQLATSPQFLELVLKTVRTDDTQVYAVKDLKTKVADGLQAPFAAAVNHQIETQTLPTSVAWVVQKKNKLLVLREDVHGGREPGSVPSAQVQRPAAEERVPSPPWLDFGLAFDEAFQRLDRQAGSHNFVSLVELRRALPHDRATFDRELRELRRAGRYSLSAAEGRHGIQPEEQEAGIREEGSLLLFVSRKTRHDDRFIPAP